MTPREKALATQCKVLADRLALALAILEDRELDFVFERESRDEPNPWTQEKLMILSDHEIWKAERKKRRGWVFYEISIERIRKWMQKSLRAVTKEKRAA